MNTSFHFHDEKGEALCIIEDKNHYFYGLATCHPNDEDFMSERTGCYIAELRARIKHLKHIKNNEIIPQINALKHVISTLGPKAEGEYTYRRLVRELRNLEEELANCINIIADTQDYIKTYIEQKDNLYKKIRAKQDESN